MPELPEVESVARQCRDAIPPLLGHAIGSLELIWPGVVDGVEQERFLQIVSGRIIRSVSRHGKYLFFGLADGNDLLFMALHLRMTGIVRTGDAQMQPGPHTRMRIGMDSGATLFFDDPRKFGRVWLVNDPTEVINSLGPDALEICAGEFASRIRQKGRQLKPLLLDQSFVAGIGNIYADESLFQAGLHPLCNTRILDDAGIGRLYQAVVSVLQEAVHAGGANIDGVFKAGEYAVRVYGREGRPCVNCGRPIEKIRVGQRGTHFCPFCQPMP